MTGPDSPEDEPDPPPELDWGSVRGSPPPGPAFARDDDGPDGGKPAGSPPLGPAIAPDDSWWDDDSAPAGSPSPGPALSQAAMWHPGGPAEDLRESWFRRALRRLREQRTDGR